MEVFRLEHKSSGKGPFMHLPEKGEKDRYTIEELLDVA